MADISATAYLAYKHDTNVFLSWMNQSSQKCGWKPRRAQKEIIPGIKTTVKPAPRLKGKERKKAKQAEAAAEAKKSSDTLEQVSSKSTVSTVELVEQIEILSRAVTRRTAEPMPFSVRRALQRCIKARERFARWYKSSNSCSSSKLESHDHFINILKKATCLFQGEYGFNQPQKPQPSEMSQKDTFTNIFECLELEDVSEPDEPDILEDGDVSPESSGADESVKLDIFDIEPLDAELDFAIFSLFEDVHRMRAEAQRIFHRLMDGNISLVNATLSIAVAFDMIRKAEEEALKLVDMGLSNEFSEFKERWFSRGAYPAFSAKLTNDRLFQKEGEITAPLESWSAYEEFILLPLGATLREMNERSEALAAGLSDLFHPFMSISTFYKDVPEMLNDSRIQRGVAEDRLLKHFYYEMRFIEDLKEGLFDGFIHGDLDKPESQRRMRKSALPFYDLFHSVLRSTWKHGTVSFEAAFAARVMLDMHEICDTSLHNSYTPPKDVTIYADRYGFPKKAGVAVDLWVRDLEIPDEEEVRILVTQVRRRIDHDLNGNALWLLARRKMGESLMSKRQEMAECDKECAEVRYGVWLHSSSTFLLDRNVLYGGTAVLDMITISEMAEIRIADYNFSIFSVAHIYNAARQLAGLDISWPEMDRVIELQKDSIFANDIPTTSKEVSRRFLYRTGLSALKKIHRTLLGSGPRPWNLQPTPTSAILREYFNGKSTLPRMVHQLQEKAAEYEASKGHKQSSRASQGSSPTPGSTKKDQRQVTLTKALQRVEDYLDAVLPDIQFDYLNLTRTCNRLLASLRLELIAHLGIDYEVSDSDTPRKSFVPAEMALMIVLENHAASIFYDMASRKAKKKDDSEDGGAKLSPIGEQLKHTATFLKKFLTEEARRASAPQDGPT
ncbi:uncharacterized protein F4807DRAFT_471684 [Annulohypoxylon truncatum]|uniref:uncharacterized protein n=1 Tax=Annulohypoxylon truncatum TaxID=327061 RepID=UPI002008C75F|nr:uncharacterized protein F4807DRAFT_471684 [Annulohypoxylon truncatum]KAI1204858.1 hypothetical protein F4807DRAFT_471684 [Annulohypoxylon truncatum]